MITFVSLFLGLVMGPQPVEVALSAPAAQVELLLDDQAVASLGGSPWKAALDFGQRLRPHRLDAVARDEAGAELGRVRQWINLPRSQAEMALTLVTRADGSRAVRVILQQAGANRSTQIRALLDGEPLPPVDRDLFELPPYDPDSFHLVEAEALLDGGSVVTAHLGVGGRFGDEIGTQMTAVPLRREGGKGMPTAAELKSALAAGGRTLEVREVEWGEVDIVVVLDPSAAAPLALLGARQWRSAAAPIASSPQANATGARAGFPLFRLRFVATQAVRDFGGTVPFDAFPVTQPFTAADGSLDYLITHVDQPVPEGAPTRVSDAVAAAGVRAAAGNRPRAVVLIVGARPDDHSRLAAEDARAYLGDLRVPFFIWSTGRPASRALSEDRLLLSTQTAWGPALDISTVSRYDRAVGDLGRALARQFVAWVEGAHLPQSIELTESAWRWALAR